MLNKRSNGALNNALFSSLKMTLMTDKKTHPAMAKIDQRFDQTATKAGLAEVRAEIHKWMLATVLTIVGTMLAAIFGVAQVMKPGTPTIQQPPIIINVPGTAPAPTK